MPLGIRKGWRDSRGGPKLRLSSKLYCNQHGSRDHVSVPPARGTPQEQWQHKRRRECVDILCRMTGLDAVTTIPVKFPQIVSPHCKADVISAIACTRQARTTVFIQLHINEKERNTRAGQTSYWETNLHASTQRALTHLHTSHRQIIRPAPRPTARLQYPIPGLKVGTTLAVRSLPP